MSRHRYLSRLVALLIIVLISGWFIPSRARGGVIDSQLEAALSIASAGDSISVIVEFENGEAPAAARGRLNAPERFQLRRQLIAHLRQRAEDVQAPVRAFLARHSPRRVQPVWINNTLAVTASPAVIDQLAAQPGVKSVRPELVFTLPKTPHEPPRAPAVWNIEATGAPRLWNQGHAGQGMVVAVLDSGVDVQHSDLTFRWRGGAGDWFDPYKQHATPFDGDRDGHGTGVTALAVGGDAGGSSIGMAPGAQWIAAKIFNDLGVAAEVETHLSFQWCLDPDGNSLTDDAPDVVNLSWGLSNRVGECVNVFLADVEALRAADIAVICAAGNDGPFGATSLSPANYAASFAVGTVNELLLLDFSSGRGPSACDGTIYPEVVAPGVNVRTAARTLNGVFPLAYQSVSGSSFASPHVAGAMALLFEALPGVSVAEAQLALQQTAMDLGAAGPDTASGWGLINVWEAYKLLVPSAVRAPWTVYE